MNDSGIWAVSRLALLADHSSLLGVFLLRDVADHKLVLWSIGQNTARNLEVGNNKHKLECSKAYRQLSVELVQHMVAEADLWQARQQSCPLAKGHALLQHSYSMRSADHQSMTHVHHRRTLQETEHPRPTAEISQSHLCSHCHAAEWVCCLMVVGSSSLGQLRRHCWTVERRVETVETRVERSEVTERQRMM